jgi:hypothetical protein
MYKAILTAISAAVTPELLDSAAVKSAVASSAQFASGTHTLQAYENGQDLIGADGDSVYIGGFVEFDAAIEYYFPLAWDGEIEELEIGTDVTFYVGGTQTLIFQTSFFALELYLDIYPLTVNLFQNFFYIWAEYDAEDNRSFSTCDMMLRGYEVNYVYLEADIGFKSCYTGLYDAVFADTTVNYTCDYEYSTLEDLAYFS